MAIVNPPSKQCLGIEVNGRSYDVGKDGRFHNVRPEDAKAMVAGGECFLATATLASGTRGWHCAKCDWRALINHCPKCGSTKLKREG
jgi:hypothetical protein